MEKNEPQGMGEVPRVEPEYRHEGHGNLVLTGPTKLLMWIVGLFGSVMIVLLTLVLQAVYTTNGNVNKLSGTQVAASAQMAAFQEQLSAMQQEILAFAQRRSGNGQ